MPTQERRSDEYLFEVPATSKEELREIRETVNSQLSWQDIFRASNRYYKIRSTGRVYALCAFHRDKTPSMVGYPETNTFICYGCRIKGDKYDFLCYQFNGRYQLSLQELQSLIRRIPPQGNTNQLKLPL